MLCAFSDVAKPLFVSDSGSDENDCLTESTPCINLQTALDKAHEGATVYITSPTVELMVENYDCWLRSKTSTTISGVSDDDSVQVLCPGKYATLVQRINVHCTSSCSIPNQKCDFLVVDLFPQVLNFSGYVMYWAMSNHLSPSGEVPLVTLKNIEFQQSLVLHILLFVRLRVDNCAFSRQSSVHMYRDKDEGDLTLESLPTNSTSVKLTVSITRSTLFSMDFTTHNTSASVEVVNSVIQQKIALDSTCERCFIVIFALISNCTMNDVFFQIRVVHANNFGHCVVQNTFLQDTNVHAEFSEDNRVGLRMENSTFFSSYTARLLYVLHPAYLHISSCHFETEDTSDCEEGCTMFVQGMVFQHELIAFSYVAEEIFDFPSDLSDLLQLTRYWYESKVLIRNTHFAGSSGGQRGGVISVKTAMLSLQNCAFEMAPHSLPPLRGGFVYHEHANALVQVFNVHFGANDLPTNFDVAKVSIFVSEAQEYAFQDVFVSCPKPLDVSLAFDPAFSVQCSFQCQDKYTLQAGSAELNGSLWPQADPNSLFKSRVTTLCLACPVGAKCSHGIKALPNYWGYKHSDKLYFVRCPDNYCCSNIDTCATIDSCNSGRRETLCGSCDQNLTESLFSAQCVSPENCFPKTILSTYCLCALLYALALVIVPTIKNKTMDMLKILYGTFIESRLVTHTKLSFRRISGRRKSTAATPIEDQGEVRAKSKSRRSDRQKRKERTREGNNQTNVVSSDSDESGMKYMQILFYYIQDASLFKVLLQSEETSQEANGILSVLQFSPELLMAYTRLSEACLTSTSTAVVKVLFKSSFGFLVLAFLFCIYLFQIIMSTHSQKCSSQWKFLKRSLIQAFLLTVLFSYQKIVTGAFTLVQCADVEGRSVLLIQSTVHCHTWWQLLVTLYICLSVIPVSISLSVLPYHVQENRLSVRVFILACLFPVPALLYHMFSQYCLKRHQPDPSVQMQTIVGKMETEQQEVQSNIVVLHVDHSKELMKDEEASFEPAEDKTLGQQEEVILHTLLRHYNCLKLFGISFTWLGVHQLYRVFLVACRTYISEPVSRVYVMTSVLLVVTIANIFLRPYKESKANKTATISYAATLCIAVINIGRAYSESFGCESNCVLKAAVMENLEIYENILMIYVPISAIAVWFLITGIGKIKKKKSHKERKDP